MEAWEAQRAQVVKDSASEHLCCAAPTPFSPQSILPVRPLPSDSPRGLGQASRRGSAE